MRISLVLLMMLQASGVVVIRTEPQAEIFWDGVSIGRADSEGVLKVRDVPLGVFRVSGRKEGFEEGGVEVRVDGGESSVRLLLKPVKKTVMPAGREMRETHAKELAPEPPKVVVQKKAEVTQEEVPDNTGRGVLLIVVLACVLGGLVTVARYRRKPQPLMQPPPALVEAAVGPLQSFTEESAFLDELKRQEEEREKDVTIVNVRPKKAIEIRPEDIREVSEES